MRQATCYIDRQTCSGARFSFCEECIKAQGQTSYAERVMASHTPAGLSLAHIPDRGNK